MARVASAILTTLRPRQWVKNAFVGAPLVFSKHLLDPAYAWRAAAAIAAFCALSGAVYAFNDVRDQDVDRAHPRKRNRPIAAGVLHPTTALIFAGALALGALVTCAALAIELLAVGGVYLVINSAYSLALKKLAFVDVLLIAAGFLLRVAGGAFAIDVPMSPWLLACTALLAAMLGFGKRAHELSQAVTAGRDPADTRAALVGYRFDVLQGILYVLALATTAAYALYTRDARTVAYFGTGRLIWTLPFCVLGIARFLQLALWDPRDHSPTEAILRDWPFMVNLALWGAVVLVIIYGWTVTN